MNNPFRVKKLEIPNEDLWTIESAKAVEGAYSGNNRVIEKEAHHDNKVTTSVIAMGINGRLLKEQNGSDCVIKVMDGTIVDTVSENIYKKGDVVSVKDWKSDTITAPTGARIIRYKAATNEMAKTIAQLRDYAPSTKKVFYIMSLLSKISIT